VRLEAHPGARKGFPPRSRLLVLFFDLFFLAMRTGYLEAMRDNQWHWQGPELSANRTILPPTPTYLSPPRFQTAAFKPCLLNDRPFVRAERVAVRITPIVQVGCVVFAHPLVSLPESRSSNGIILFHSTVPQQPLTSLLCDSFTIFRAASATWVTFTVFPYGGDLPSWA
jgi:hypothetical protein